MTFTGQSKTFTSHVFLCVSGTSIVFDMSLTYILVALLAVILNNVLVERISLHTRITVGKLRHSFVCEKCLIIGPSTLLFYS